MKQKIPFYYHAALLVFVFIIYELYDISASGKMLEYNLYMILLDITHWLSVFGAYLVGYYYFCPFISKNKTVVYALFVPLQLIIFAALRFALQEGLIYYITGYHNYFSLNPIPYVIDNFYYGFPAVMLSLLMYLSWQSKTYSKYSSQLEIENRQAQLQLLKSQISPHFLFNTLNSFYSEMVDKDENIAADLLTLSDLLRYTLTESNKETVLLHKELEFITNYINLQEKRFENQLFLDYEVKGNCTTQSVLPAVLIHFVENIFKHAKLNDPAKPAVISISINNDSLEIKTFNYLQGGENYYATGIGYENLLNRLKYTYNDNFVLEKTQENDTFTTYLKMPLQL